MTPGDGGRAVMGINRCLYLAWRVAPAPARLQRRCPGCAVGAEPCGVPRGGRGALRGVAAPKGTPAVPAAGAGLWFHPARIWGCSASPLAAPWVWGHPALSSCPRGGSGWGTPHRDPRLSPLPPFVAVFMVSASCQGLTWHVSSHP